VLLAPSPRLNRELYPHNRGFPVGPAGNPLSPSPCSSLFQADDSQMLSSMNLFIRVWTSAYPWFVYLFFIIQNSKKLIYSCQA